MCSYYLYYNFDLSFTHAYTSLYSSEIIVYVLMKETIGNKGS